jgi:hypothetical protein
MDKYAFNLFLLYFFLCDNDNEKFIFLSNKHYTYTYYALEILRKI